MSGTIVSSRFSALLVVVALGVVGSCASASASPLFSRLPGEPTVERYAPAGATLPDGNVLIAGGEGEELLPTAELFNTKTSTFEKLEGATHELREPREEFSAVTLHDGHVLLVGGSRTGTSLQTAELFDPQTNTFELLKSQLTQARDAPAVALLANGSVLIADGCQHGTCAKTAELYDPATQTFSTLASSPVAARYYPGAATLADGNVLIAGGYPPGPGGPVKTAELFNAKTGKFEALEGAAHEMHEARGEFSAVTLQDGKVLIPGGDQDGKPIAKVELFNPQTSAFEPAATELTTERDAPAVALLPSGRVLIADGCQHLHCEKSAELMSVNPPALAKTARSTRRPHHRFRINALVEAETNSTVYFQYGTSRRYRHRTRAQAVAGSTSPVSVSALLSGLKAGKRYHYRVVIENSIGKLVGRDRTFVVPRRRG